MSMNLLYGSTEVNDEARKQLADRLYAWYCKDDSIKSQAEKEQREALEACAKDVYQILSEKMPESLEVLDYLYHRENGVKLLSSCKFKPFNLNVSPEEIEKTPLVAALRDPHIPGITIALIYDERKIGSRPALRLSDIGRAVVLYMHNVMPTMVQQEVGGICARR